MTNSFAGRFSASSRLLLAVLAIAVSPRGPYAQPPAAATTPPARPLAYDVVSIKQNKTGSGSTSMSTNDNYFAATNVSLKQLVEFAYDIREDMISGITGPVDSVRFDVEAKALSPDSGPPPKLTDKQLQGMLIPLLADRFHIQSHTEMKTLPVYELQIAKGGPKIKPTVCDTESSSMNMRGKDNNLDLSTKCASMAQFGNALSNQVHRAILDKTGLTGGFDLELKWAPDDISDADPDSALSIFTAMQEQLGLKLQSSHGPVDTLVIDHVEMPSEN